MHNARVEKVISKAAEAGLDSFLVTSLPNIFYLSGFTGSTAMLLLTPQKRWFITDFRYHEQVSQQVKGGFELFDNTGKKLTEEVIPALAGESGVKSMGFEADHVSFSTYEKLNSMEGRTVRAQSGLIEGLRMVKDEAEIELIRASVLLNERIFGDVLGVIGPETTESDLAAEIYFRSVKYGAEGVSFSPIVASGPNASKPHAGFTGSKLVEGAPLTFDMGVKLNGYCSDMTRTVFYKDCPQEWREIYGIVKGAKDAVHRVAKPGMTGKEVDAAARNLIADAGYGDNFGHGLGHGVGIEVHEGPRLAKVSDQALEPGNVVTNEPGIYLPGKGGVRIEDIMVITAEGSINLNETSTEIEVIG